MAVWISLLARAEVGAACWGVKNWYRSCRTKPLLILGPCAYLDRRLREGGRQMAAGTAPPAQHARTPGLAFGALTGWPFKPLACLSKFGSQTYSHCPCGLPFLWDGAYPPPSSDRKSAEVECLDISVSWISETPPALCGPVGEFARAGARLEAVKIPSLTQWGWMPWLLLEEICFPGTDSRRVEVGWGVEWGKECV